MSRPKTSSEEPNEEDVFEASIGPLERSWVARQSRDTRQLGLVAQASSDKGSARADIENDTSQSGAAASHMKMPLCKFMLANTPLRLELVRFVGLPCRPAPMCSHQLPRPAVALFRRSLQAPLQIQGEWDSAWFVKAFAGSNHE